eukprot:CAMPEP_0119398544 /NCGR_PEP_ID=MMETSP1334-20130426/140898_1 /TAXON_ID=127549 /ORGANISM="Calcidiscus leptoporus, Strain RCC1130" /LENGTH=66 /DNA_ID=CAMNT_0007422411 /DNA_START=869 /DNA_END=1069 /DNA_ORIENTATION=+
MSQLSTPIGGCNALGTTLTDSASALMAKGVRQYISNLFLLLVFLLCAKAHAPRGVSVGDEVDEAVT